LTIDDFVEQVGGVRIIGEITNLGDAQQFGTRVGKTSDGRPFPETLSSRVAIVVRWTRGPDDGNIDLLKGMLSQQWAD
jgi:hypothetical protein